jgi:alpha-N-acetylglucosamine transferase
MVIYTFVKTIDKKTLKKLIDEQKARAKTAQKHHTKKQSPKNSDKNELLPVFSVRRYGKDNQNAIFTISIYGLKHHQMQKYSLITIENYAKKIGVDLIIQNRSLIKHKLYSAHLEKFNIKELLDHYNRILYVDNDILIKKNTPNIFEIYKDEDSIYMLDEVGMNNHQDYFGA